MGLIDLSIMEDMDYLTNFSLDMVSTDMNFEQAYSMYNSLQQEQALSSVDHLQKVQHHHGASPGVFDHSPGAANDANFSYHRSKILNMQMNLHEESPSTPHQFHNSHQHHHSIGSIQPGSLEEHQHQHPATGNPRSLSLDAPHQKLDASRLDDDEEEEEGEDSQDEEFDKFFSNTESNALEKFLDNLANPSHTTNPLDLYHHDFNFKPKKDLTQKNDISNVFAHPSMDPLYHNKDSAINTQLPTPESRQSSIDEDNLHPDELDMNNSKKRSISQQRIKEEFQSADLLQSSSMSSMDDDLMMGSPSQKKRRRSTTKPLLSLEQKRLNHSHSEQKRRQLCKLAYERCLRLITNFETYSKRPPINKKSKRKLYTKEGLPNLSKHCALVKISGEISKIKNKNEQLTKLLHQN